MLLFNTINPIIINIHNDYYINTDMEANTYFNIDYVVKNSFMILT